MGKRKSTTDTNALDPSHLQCLSVPDVARLLCVSRATVYALIADGELQTVKIRSDQRILVVSVFQFVERQTQN